MKTNETKPRASYFEDSNWLPYDILSLELDRQNVNHL